MIYQDRHCIAFSDHSSNKIKIDQGACDSVFALQKYLEIVYTPSKALHLPKDSEEILKIHQTLERY